MSSRKLAVLGQQGFQHIFFLAGNFGSARKDLHSSQPVFLVRMAGYIDGPSTEGITAIALVGGRPLGLWQC